MWLESSYNLQYDILVWQHLGVFQVLNNLNCQKGHTCKTKTFLIHWCCFMHIGRWIGHTTTFFMRKLNIFQTDEEDKKSISSSSSKSSLDQYKKEMEVDVDVDISAGIEVGASCQSASSSTSDCILSPDFLSVGFS